VSQLIYEALRNSDYDVADWEDETVRGLADFIAKEIADRDERIITMDLSTQQASLEEIARSGLLAQAWQPGFEPATQGWQDWFACGDEIV
jgi:hypothetical protein